MVLLRMGKLRVLWLIALLLVMLIEAPPFDSADVAVAVAGRCLIRVSEWLMVFCIGETET